MTQTLMLFTNPQKLKNNDCKEISVNNRIQVNQVDRCDQIQGINL